MGGSDSGMPEGGPGGAIAGLQSFHAAFIYTTSQEMVPGIIIYLLTLSLSTAFDFMQSFKAACLVASTGHIKAFISLRVEGSDP
jgi:hypothetical protein